MAGFWAGFGEQLSTNIKQRKKTLDNLIQENLDNARTAKSSYAKRKGTADQVLKSAQAIRNKFGLTDAQALAITEAYGTDLPKLQVTLDAENDKLKSNMGVGYTANDVMTYVSAAEQLNLPEGMTLDQGVQRLMGLNYQELAKEADPKSEGSKTRSFIRAALAYDPQLNAAEQMQNIKGPDGLSYAQLLEMQETGFAPDTVFGGVTRAGGVTYDYTASTAKQTRTDYASRLSVKLFDADLTNPVDFDNYLTEGDTSKGQHKASIHSTGEALARLEKDIVLANRGTDLAMSGFRKAILDDIYSRVDSPEELETLRESIASGKALEIVQRTGGKLTDRDIDAIILGAEPDAVEEDAPQPDALETTTPETIPETLPVATPTVTLDEDTQAKLDAIPDEDKPDLAGVEDPDVARMIVEQAVSAAAAQVETTSAKSTQQINIDNKTKLREAMSSVTEEEWENMSRSERKKKALPVRSLDMWFAGSDAFKGNELPSTTVAPEGSVAAVETTSAAAFIQDNDQRILDELESQGLTGESSKEDVKRALADFYRANEDDPAIGGYVTKASVQDLDRIVDVFMLTLKELEK